MLQLLDELDGGQNSFNELMRCFVEVNFGYFRHVPHLQGAAATAIGKLESLSLDLRWANEVSSLSMLDWHGSCCKLQIAQNDVSRHLLRKHLGSKH